MTDAPDLESRTAAIRQSFDKKRCAGTVFYQSHDLTDEGMSRLTFGQPRVIADPTPYGTYLPPLAGELVVGEIANFDIKAATAKVSDNGFYGTFPVIYRDHLMVDPAHRRQGHGTRSLELLRAIAKQQHMHLAIGRPNADSERLIVRFAEQELGHAWYDDDNGQPCLFVRLNYAKKEQ